MIYGVKKNPLKIDHGRESRKFYKSICLQGRAVVAGFLFIGS
jgi:hypothetical protein